MHRLLVPCRLEATAVGAPGEIIPGVLPSTLRAAASRRNGKFREIGIFLIEAAVLGVFVQVH